ncbi:cyclin, putative [Plasmodium gallinaceum]|uniref:Cyclin, putative n=1 Tax=Plasmodium gallinaceum TaxID=5849 RepID=A0A1J1GML8_PLAGA|nr:cyclin, putative [Plasmodium gallinaceum]CRG93579.1 cyclin, putative [Plasmodium gallinaceum]
MDITYRNKDKEIKLKNMNFSDQNNNFLKNINNLKYKKNNLKNNFISKFSFNEHIEKINKKFATCKDLKHMEYFCDKILNNEITKKLRYYKNIINFYKNYNYIIIKFNMVKIFVLENKKKKKYLFEYKNENEALKKDAEIFQNIIKEHYIKINKYNKKFNGEMRYINQINKNEKINKEKNILKKKKTYKTNLFKILAIFLDDIVKKYFFFEDNKVNNSYLILISKNKNNNENFVLETYKYSKINFIKKYSPSVKNMFSFLSNIYQIQRKNTFYSDNEYIKNDKLFLKRLNFKLRKIFYILNVNKFMKISTERRFSKIKDRKKEIHGILKREILKKRVKCFIYNSYLKNYYNKLFKIKKKKKIRLSMVKLLKFHKTKLRKKIQNIEEFKKCYKLKCENFKKCILNTLELIISNVNVTKLKKKNVTLIENIRNCFFFITTMKNKKLIGGVINIKKKYKLIKLKKIQKYQNHFKSIKNDNEPRNMLKSRNFQMEFPIIANKDILKEKLHVKKYNNLLSYNSFIIEIIINKNMNHYRYTDKKTSYEVYFLVGKKKINKIIISKNITKYIKKKYKYLYYLKKKENFIIKHFIDKLYLKNKLCCYFIKNIKGSKRKLPIQYPFLQNEINKSFLSYNINNRILKYINNFKERNLKSNIKINNTNRQLELYEKKNMINNTEEIIDFLIRINNKFSLKKWVNEENLKFKPDKSIEKTENSYNKRKRTFSTFYLNELNKNTNNKINEHFFVKNKYNKINFLKKNIFHREITKNTGYYESNNNNNSNTDIYPYEIKKKVMIDSFNKDCNKFIIEKLMEKKDKNIRDILIINLTNKKKSEAKSIQRRGYNKNYNLIGKYKIKRSNRIRNSNYNNNIKGFLNMNNNNLNREINRKHNNNYYFDIFVGNNKRNNLCMYNNANYNGGYINNTTDNNTNVYLNYFDKNKIIDNPGNLLFIEKNKIYNRKKELQNGINFLFLNSNINNVATNSLRYDILKKYANHTNLKSRVKCILKNKYKERKKKRVSSNFPYYMNYLKKKKKISYNNINNFYKENKHLIHNNELKKEDLSKCSECINIDLYKVSSLGEFSNLLNENKNEGNYKYDDKYNTMEINNIENYSNDKYNESNMNCVSYFKNSLNGKSYFENNSIDESDFEDNLNNINYFRNNKRNTYYLSDIFDEKSLEIELSIKSKSENKSVLLGDGENNNISITSGIKEENILNENLMNNKLMDDSSLLYEKESKELVQKNRKKKKKKKNLDCILNEDLPLESIDNILKNNCDINLENNYNEEEKPIEDNFESDNNKESLKNNIDLEVAVMERHSSILINRGIKTKKCVDYSLYNTYAKSSFLQCAEQADNHFIGNYLDRYNDENFYHLRQKIKLCLSRTFANLKTTSETCVLHFTNLIFDLYISRFNSKEEIIDSIINDIVTEEKQFSDVMVQLLKEFYPKIYNDFIYKEQLKNKYKILYQELKESCDLIYHFIAIICLFISQKYYNYRLISIDLIAKTYCKSHLEGLRKVYALNNDLIKDASPDYYSATQYLDTTFSSHSVNKNFALEVEICILKKLNYDLSIPTAYSLLDSLLKANENINFLKVRNDYNSTEGEILLRIANIDNIFLKYKSSTLAMAIYEILNFNICKDKMQRELFDFTKLSDFNHVEEISMRREKDNDFDLYLEKEKKEKEKKNELKFLKRQARSLIIAEEEDRFITASKYINEKTKIYKYIKKIIIKLCFLIKKKIPKSYYNCDYNLSEKLSSHIKRFHKSKIAYLNRIKMKKLNKAKKGVDINIKNEETEKFLNTNSSVKIYKISKEFGNNALIDVKNKIKENNKNHKIEEQQKHMYESEKKKKLEEIRNDEIKFQSIKNKIIEKLNKCIKKLIKLKYDDIPIKYCTTHILEGDKLKIYIKNDNDIENINNANKMKKNSLNNVKDMPLKYNFQTRSKSNYIIGTRTKSTDEHLVYYYNYISKLKSRLINGLKYFLRRIKKIKNREVYVQKMNMSFLFKKRKRKKRKKEKTLKNIPLYKQLLNEIKIFFLWIYKLTNIEIRPLINFSDLKFISVIKYYEKNYSKYVLRKLNYMDDNSVEQDKKIAEENFEDFKMSSKKTMKRGRDNDIYENHTNKIVKKDFQEKKSKVLNKIYIEEVKSTIEGGEKFFYPFLKSTVEIKRLKNKEDIIEHKENIKGNDQNNKNVLILENVKCENTKNKTNFYEKIKYMKNNGGEIIEEKKKKESERDKDDNSLLGKKEHESLEKQKDKFGENVENNHLFSVTNFENLAKINSDWITINDPQVDECAKELMECFLKWKNQDYISKNWTFNEYPNCKEYYFSLVFGDLKSSEALKGIIEMMHMKYNHLLNIYKEINIQNNLLYYE